MFKTFTLKRRAKEEGAKRRGKVRIKERGHTKAMAAIITHKAKVKKRGERTLGNSLREVLRARPKRVLDDSGCLLSFILLLSWRLVRINHE